MDRYAALFMNKQRIPATRDAHNTMAAASSSDEVTTRRKISNMSMSRKSRKRTRRGNVNHDYLYHDILEMPVLPPDAQNNISTMIMRRTQQLTTTLLKSRSNRWNRNLSQCMERFQEQRSSSTVAFSQKSWRQQAVAPMGLPGHQNPSFSSVRRCFSSEYTTFNEYSNNGLVKVMVEPHFESIRQLPEVNDALQHWYEPLALEQFQRAIQVFEMMQAGGPLHIAVLVLLSECFQYQGKYKEASRTLQTLQQLPSTSANDEARLLVDFAAAKTLWFQGDFDRSMNEVKKMIDNNASHDSDVVRGCVMNAEGLVKLMNAPRAPDEDAKSAVQVLESASELLEKDSKKGASATLASASVRGNLGIGMVVTRLGIDESDLDPLTFDEELSAFRAALNILDKLEASSGPTTLIRSHVYCNMAWTLLEQEKGELKLASEYSSSALSHAEKLLEQGVSEQKYRAALGRSLRLVASCYAKADSALTAEGLFQSSIDSLGQACDREPLALLDLRDAYENYATLLHQWDKRSRDAEIQEEKGREVDEALSEGWKNKSSICSGLMFITP